MRISLLLAGYCTLVPLVAALAMRFDAGRERGDVTLLNVSYDPTRELWRDVNQRFIADYLRESGRQVAIRQSHGGSASQARSVIDGLPADVVTLAMGIDTRELWRRGLLADGWEDRFPYHSSPYHSTIVFVVRRGNPKAIHDWNDLVRPGVEVVTPNPKTSGNGKLAFVAAWGAQRRVGRDDADAQRFVEELYRHVPILDTGARGAATTFAQNGRGDVQLTWENEAYLEKRESGDGLEIVYPPRSIRADPLVAVVDAVVDARQTREVAQAYLNYLYRPATQELIADHYLRPSLPEVLERRRDRFPAIDLFDVTQVATDWAEAQRRFFDAGGVFDQIYARKNQGQ